MEVDERKICRLCLEISESKLETLEEYIQEIFTCLPNLDLDIISEPVACENCVDSLKKCFKFKTKCLSTEDRIASFADIKSSTELDLREIYLSEVGTEDMTIADEHVVCRFSLDLVKSGKDLRTELADMLVLLERYIPEMDLTITKDSLICTPCCESLQHYASFVCTCQSVEEKIKVYREFTGASNVGHVELSSVLRFTFDGTLKSEEGDSLNIVKNEECGEEDVDAEFESKVEIEKQELQIKKESVTKTEEGISNSDEETTPLPQPNAVPTVPMYTCEVCAYQTKYRGYLKVHALKHKNVAEGAKLKCELCASQFKCKTYLQAHMRTHKSASEVMTYKCGECIFESRYRYNLKKHMVVHKNAAEVKTHKCEACTFESRHKYNLTKHMLVHRDSSTYKCEVCQFKTKHKASLQEHMLIHKSSSELPMYKCEACEFQSKRRRTLYSHMMTHKSLMEVPVYKCEECGFQTKYKRSIETHVFSHRKESKVPLYNVHRSCILRDILTGKSTSTGKVV